jgi:hypothetical protein
MIWLLKQSALRLCHGFGIVTDEETIRLGTCTVDLACAWVRARSAMHASKCGLLEYEGKVFGCATTCMALKIE